MTRQDFLRLATLFVVLCPSSQSAFNCVPDVPPQTALLQVSTPDAAGEATVAGQAGAVISRVQPESLGCAIRQAESA